MNPLVAAGLTLGAIAGTSTLTWIHGYYSAKMRQPAWDWERAPVSAPIAGSPRIHTSVVGRACDALLWHPECPPMPDGTEGLAAAMEAALQAVREDLAGA